jgi:hypothetical protein
LGNLEATRKPTRKTVAAISATIAITIAVRYPFSWKPKRPDPSEMNRAMSERTPKPIPPMANRERMAPA